MGDKTPEQLGVPNLEKVIEKADGFTYNQGPQRPYLIVESLTKNSTLKVSRIERLHLFILTVACLASRLALIDFPSSVVSDELRLGSLINAYIRGEYFVDSHPPLVKLIYSAVAQLLHYNGSFPFTQVGQSYTIGYSELLVPYVALRGVSAFCGVGLTLLTYKILRTCGVRHYVALFGGFLTTFENSLITQSRFFLLDAPTLFFMSMAVSMIKTTDVSKTFSKSWFKAVIGGGLGIAFTISSKWIGFYLMIWVGIVVLKRVWLMIGDLSLSRGFIIKYSITKLIVWVIMPSIVYLSIFAIHVSLLPFVGPGYHFMTPEYQHSLIGNHLDGIPSEVSYGSTVSIRHYNTGRYLHSHDATYPKSGSPQVIAYDYEDSNNYFFIEKRIKSNMGELLKKTKEIETGRQLRLFHNNTEQYLHINPDQKPPISETDYNKEVTRMGNMTWRGDNFLNLEVRIAKDYTKTAKGKTRLRALDSAFQLFSVKNNCYLVATENKLPDWGLGQHEVICTEKPLLKRSLWYIEENIHEQFTERTPTVEFNDLSILEKIVLVHKAMFQYNKGDATDKEFNSKATDWLFVKRGMTYWIQDHKTIYFLGNIGVYTLTSLAIIGFIIFKIGHIVSYNPNVIASYTPDFIKLDHQGIEFLLGFLVQFVPLLMSKKSLYADQYLPSLFFAILLTCQILEYVVFRSRFVGYLLIILSSIFIFAAFKSLRPIIYGLDWTKRECQSLRFKSTWDIFCEGY
ncbi:glycosyltransferase family 39 protein [[Candida] arabinofermentans NRRL YB-2248]|uniref:Dolichyl-phosphate-mannose--protein mannosyltransferase n=1 Tax=[Candida] arabinofermentans NRRL YB-2248 TaxID=983967 RepID=A0A1E4SV03_9ASCO|nr:glycosyltransferase family 39 protein [[Candida] arabinofermentans NRRL YB-2248]